MSTITELLEHEHLTFLKKIEAYLIYIVSGVQSGSVIYIYIFIYIFIYMCSFSDSFPL